MTIQINSSLNINDTVYGTNYRTAKPAFTIGESVTRGPSPGSLQVTVEGVDVSLANLSVPGFCEIRNNDDTNFVTLGIWDGTTFYPFMEVGPKRHCVYEVARDLGDELGTGTGTTGASINTLRLKADTATCDVFVGIFEKGV